MSLIRKVARPLLGASFVAHGVDRLRNTEEAAEKLEPALQEIGALLPQAEALVSDPKRTAQVLGGVEVAAGLALAAGRFPRLAALTLCGVHTLNSYTEYRGAALDDVHDLSAQRTILLKNVSILGGLKLAAVDLDGKPSLAWRAEHIAKQSKKKGAKFRDKTIKWAEDLGDDAVKTAKSLEKEAKKNFARAEKDAKKAITKAAKTAEKKSKDVL